MRVTEVAGSVDGACLKIKPRGAYLVPTMCGEIYGAKNGFVRCLARAKLYPLQLTLAEGR